MVRSFWSFIACAFLATFSVFAQTSAGSSIVIPSDLPFEKSIEETSRHFLDVKYVDGPLGEGEDGQYDQDPLYRFDEFDCQTFVETVLALHRSSDVDSFKVNINEIRYFDGVVSYQTRLHFSETQWVPENQRNDVFADITGEFPFQEIPIQIDLQAWYQAKQFKQLQVEKQTSELLADFQREGEGISPMTATISYIPVGSLNSETILKIPVDTILLFIRKNDDPKISATPVMVSHMGFVVENNGRKMYRHAAYNDKVLDIDLEKYLENFKSQSARPKFPSVGIKVLEITE